MTVKERLHRLVDAMDEHQAARLLDDLQADPAPVLYTLDNAPPDDEPYTDEERAAVAEAWEDVRAGGTIPHEEVKRMFGLA